MSRGRGGSIECFTASLTSIDRSTYLWSGMVSTNLVEGQFRHNRPGCSFRQNDMANQPSNAG